MLSEGDEAPDFTLPDQEGNPVTLSELRGRPVVVYFYPRADTSVHKGSNTFYLTTEQLPPSGGTNAGY